MTETTHCPDCRAKLVLPVLPAGQTVQCARCQHVFEPARQRVVSSPAQLARVRPMEDADTFDNDVEMTPRYQPLHGEWKAFAAMIALALSVLSFGLQLYVNFERSQVIQLEEKLFGARGIHFGRFPPRPDPQEIALQADFERRSANLQSRSMLASRLHHLTFWPAVLLFLIWVHQAARNLRILNVAGSTYYAGIVPLSFFIPIGNLYQPYVGVQDIWRASIPTATRDSLSWQSGGRSYVVVLWWLSFLAGAFLYMIGLFMGDDDFVDGGPQRLFLGGLGQTRIWCASNLFMILAGVALIAVIYSVRARQRARHARIYD